MRKIRADLVGAVMAGEGLYAAGDDVPDGVNVHPSLLESAEDAEAAQKAADEAEAAQKAAEEAEAAQKAAEDAEAAQKAAEDVDDEDFSDLLAEEPAEKPAAERKTTSGRKPAAKKA